MKLIFDACRALHEGAIQAVQAARITLLKDTRLGTLSRRRGKADLMRAAQKANK
jgi:hypothetical protein